MTDEWADYPSVDLSGHLMAEITKEQEDRIVARILAAFLPNPLVAEGHTFTFSKIFPWASNWVRGSCDCGEFESQGAYSLTCEQWEQHTKSTETASHD